MENGRQHRIDFACEYGLRTAKAREIFRDLAQKYVDYTVFWDSDSCEAELYDGAQAIIVCDNPEFVKNDNARDI